MAEPFMRSRDIEIYIGYVYDHCNVPTSIIIIVAVWDGTKDRKTYSENLCRVNIKWVLPVAEQDNYKYTYTCLL